MVISVLVYVIEFHPVLVENDIEAVWANSLNAFLPKPIILPILSGI